MFDIKYLIYFLPFVSIFTTGFFFPVNKKMYKPVFQPPSWIFGIMWLYITIAFGFVTYNFYKNSVEKSKKIIIIILYSLILLMLNVWLILNNKGKYKSSFWLLIISCFTSIMYLMYLNYNSKNKNILFLLPLPLWLVLASTLNAVIYDYNCRRINQKYI